MQTRNNFTSKRADKQEIDLVLQVGYENTNIIQKSETFFSLCDVATGKHMHKESQHA